MLDVSALHGHLARDLLRVEHPGVGVGEVLGVMAVLKDQVRTASPNVLSGDTQVYGKRV